MKIRRKVSYLIITMFIMALVLVGCGPNTITVADDIEETEEYRTIDHFELKDNLGSEREDIGYCSILIPNEYVPSEDEPGMYVSSIYPIDSSNINYTVASPGKPGYVADDLSMEDYKDTIEEAMSSVGKKIDLIIDSFEKTELEGVPCFKIRSHYEIGDVSVEQLTYLVLSRQTHIITYTQMSDDGLMVDFENAEGTIRLVREKSQS